MGQTLSEPAVEKTSDRGRDDRLVFGVSSMQGWRISMEDAHACVLDLKPETGETANGEKVSTDRRISFFGVYDGHGGDKVAMYAGENVHKIIAKQEALKGGDIERAIKDGFLATDRAILNDPKYEEEVSGCTACVALITDDKIYVGNAGDSRSVLGIKGRAKPMSFDHKPQNDSEKARIQAAGGFVDFGRVNGNLALSRAIGDFEFKKSAELPPESQIVTAYPDVLEHDITDDDEFLVVACDGIWDCQSSQAVTEFVRRGIVTKQDLAAICENLMDNCLATNTDTGGVGCDNMTVIIIGFLRGKTKEEWYKMISDRVANGDGPCAPPEYAEFRGPGIHHRYDDSPEDFDMDIDHRTQSFGGLGGRVIFLGDGTEISSDAADPDSEMFDHDDEDADLDMQVNRGPAEEGDDDADPKFSTERSQREGTPGPTPAPNPETPPTTTESPKARAHTESPSSSVATELSDHTETESISSKSESKIMPASDREPPAKEQETS